MKERCSGNIRHIGGFYAVQCSRNASVREMGKWWCGTHSPSGVEARAKRQREKFAVLLAKEKRRDKIFDARASVVKTAIEYRRGIVTREALWRGVDYLEGLEGKE